MNEFVEFNLPGYSLNEDRASIKDKFCIFCQRKNMQFINLNSCEHANVLENLLEIKIVQLDQLICSWCHNTLKKINNFKIQTLESFNILNSGLKYNNIKKYPQNLKLSKIEQQSTINSQPIEFKTIDHPIKSETFEIETNVEIKIEQDDYSDFENDLPLTQISKTIQNYTETDESFAQIIKRKQSGKKTKSSLPQSNKKAKSNKKSETTCKPQIKKRPRCEDKVKIIVMSEQEMLENRKLDALNCRYLKLPYKCEKCLTGFDHEPNLIEHIEKRHKKLEGGHVCRICESVLNTKPSYEEHYKRHFRRYECIQCGKRSNNVYTVLKHYSETHGKVDMTFACKLCDFTTDSHRSYRYHREKHRGSNVACSQCGNTFVTKSGLRVHMLTVHKQSSRIYSCEPCGKVYSTKSGLSAHITYIHADVAPAYCVTCNINFRSEAGLNHHLKTASKHVPDDAKRNTCNDCDAKFLTKRLLQEHIDWVHLNSTNHTCSKCSKSFKNERNLKRHLMFVHEKIRPPRNKICDHCGRGFTSWSILRSHIRTHTGERPLQCPHCAATFAHSAALYTHNKLLHSKLK